MFKRIKNFFNGDKALVEEVAALKRQLDTLTDLHDRLVDELSYVKGAANALGSYSHKNNLYRKKLKMKENTDYENCV